MIIPLILALGLQVYQGACTLNFEMLQEGAYCTVHMKTLTAVSTEEECALQVLNDADCGPAFTYYPAPGSLEVCACPRKDGDDPHCEQRVYHGAEYATYHFKGYTGTDLLGTGVVSSCGACTTSTSGSTCSASCRTGYVGAGATFTCSGNTFSGSISCSITFELIENGMHCTTHVKSLTAVSYTSQCAAAILADSDCGPAFYFVPETHCVCTRADGDDPHCQQRASQGSDHAAYHLVGYSGTNLLNEGVFSQCGACTNDAFTCTASCRSGFVGPSSNFACNSGSLAGSITCGKPFGLLENGVECTSNPKELTPVSYVSECAAAVISEAACGPMFSFKPGQQCDCTRIAEDDAYCDQRSSKSGSATYQLLGHSDLLRKEGITHNCKACITATEGQTCTAMCKPGYAGASATFTCASSSWVGNISCSRTWRLVETGAVCSTHLKSLVPTNFVWECASAVLQDPDCGPSFSFYTTRNCDCPRLDGDDPHCSEQTPRADHYLAYEIIGYRDTPLAAEGVTSDCDVCTPATEGATCTASCKTGYIGGASTFVCQQGVFVGQVSCSPIFELTEDKKHCTLGYTKALSVFSYASHCAAEVANDPDCGPGFSFTPNENCFCTKEDSDDPHCHKRLATVKPSSSFRLAGYTGTSLFTDGVISDCEACTPLGMHGATCTASCLPGHDGATASFTCSGNSFNGSISCTPTFKLIEEGVICTMHVKALPAITSASACAAAVLSDADCGPGFSFYPGQQCNCTKANGDDPHCNHRLQVIDTLYSANHLEGYTGTSLLDEGVVSNCGACIHSREGQKCSAFCRPGYMGSPANFTCDGNKFVGKISCRPTFSLIENEVKCLTHPNLPFKKLPKVAYASHCAEAVLQSDECGPAFFFSPWETCECTRVGSDDPHCNRRGPFYHHAAYHLTGYTESSLLDAGVMSACGSCNAFSHGKTCQASCRAGYVGQSQSFTCDGGSERFVGTISCLFLFKITQKGAYCNKHIKTLPAVAYFSECAFATVQDADCGPAFSFHPHQKCDCPLVMGDDPHCKRRVFEEDSPSNSYHLMGYEGSSLMSEGVQSNCGACFADVEGKVCEASCRSGYVGDSSSFTCSGGVFQGSIKCIPTFVYIEEGAYCSKHVKQLDAVGFSSECAVSTQKDPECGPAFSFYPRTKCECTRIAGDDPHCDHRTMTVKSTSAYHLSGYNGTSMFDEGVISDCGSCIDFPDFKGTKCKASCRPGYYRDEAGRYVGGSTPFVCAGIKFDGDISCNPTFELLEERASCTMPTKGLPPVNYASQCASQVMKDADCGRAFVFREMKSCECAKLDGGDPLCNRRFKHDDADVDDVDITSTYRLLEDIPPAAIADMPVSFTLVATPAPSTSTSPSGTTTSLPANYRGKSTTQEAKAGAEANDITTSSQPNLTSISGSQQVYPGRDPGSDDLLDLVSEDLLETSTTKNPSDITTTRKFVNAVANKPAVVQSENQKAVASRCYGRYVKSAVILLFMVESFLDIV
eukprot:gnl/MRDRNA2_/MRDRNA2_61024_c0_seq1.p1 gnl/MRDRNA2_/MRDRNA2_61024_c0~~gnl/MRDRNA2_/MRDRNA2_61024_c0_seq1.p1  ORF type:complete len:1496 (+),score=204.33 gnl/MRDRNA2_/MRDRNA2_61024_c0_seq1:186-4673(+)